MFDTPDDPNTQHTGTIVVSAEYIYSTEEIPRLHEENQESQHEEDHQRPLQEEQERERKEQQQYGSEEAQHISVEETRHLVRKAKAAKEKELDPNSLVNKVSSLIKKLEALGGLVNTIEQLTKVFPALPFYFIKTLKHLSLAESMDRSRMATLYIPVQGRFRFCK